MHKFLCMFGVLGYFPLGMRQSGSALDRALGINGPHFLAGTPLFACFPVQTLPIGTRSHVYVRTLGQFVSGIFPPSPRAGPPC